MSAAMGRTGRNAMRTYGVVALLALAITSTVSCDRNEQPGPAPRFQRTYGGQGDEDGKQARQTTDGGYIIAGEVTPPGSYEFDAILVRTDSIGKELWSRTFGGPGNDWFAAAIETPDAGFIAVGVRDTNDQDIYVVKTDSSGNTLWTRTYSLPGWQDACALEQTDDGGFIIAGTTDGEFSMDVYLVRLTPVGEVLWTVSVGSDNDEYATSVVQTADGGCITAGTAGDYYSELQNCYLVKVDARGALEWTERLGGENRVQGRCIRQTDDRGYAIVGTSCTPDGESANVYLARTDADGELLWTKTCGGGDRDEGISLALAEDGGFILAGNTESYGAGWTDVYVIRTDASGDTLWTRTFGTSADESCSSVCRTADSGFVIAGTADRGGDQNYDIYLIKADAEGDAGDSLH